MQHVTQCFLFGASETSDSCRSAVLHCWLMNEFGGGRTNAHDGSFSCETRRADSAARGGACSAVNACQTGSVGAKESDILQRAGHNSCSQP